MYNLDKYIADFLIKNKKLSAQGIGDFAIVNGQAVNGAPLVDFAADKKAYTTDELIAFVAEQERKNKIVTGFDLESHFNQIKQFINIGTPWIIPGLGQLQFGRNRELEFVQQAQTENALQERIKRKQASSEPQYATYETGITATPEKIFNNSTLVFALLIVLALGAGGYYFYANQSNSEPVVTTADTAATATDTVVSVPSSSNMNNTITNTQPPGGSDATSNEKSATSSTVGTTGFRFVLNRTTNPVYAVKRYKQLKTYGTKVYIDSAKRDSYSLYKIYLLQDAPTSDTTRLKDSLTKYYGKPVTIEKPQ